MFKVGDKVYVRAVVKTVINFGENPTFVLTCENDPDQIPLGVFTKGSIVRRDSLQTERDLAEASSTLDSLGYEKKKQTGKDGEEYTVWQKKAVDSELQSVADRFEGEVPTRPCAAGTPFNSRISEAFISTAKIKENPMPDYERTSSPMPPPEQGEPKGGCGFAQVETIKFGQAELKPYEETQDAKLELISTLVALADATKDEVTSVMLRFAVKQILQRDFKIDFDSGAQEARPHIPQPKSI